MESLLVGTDTKMFSRPSFGAPYYSPEYLSLKESLGKEINTTVQVYTSKFVESDRPAVSLYRSKILFDLATLDGEALFSLEDEQCGRLQVKFSETGLTKCDGDRGPAVELVAKIKKAQSYALHGVANLIMCPSLFPAVQAAREWPNSNIDQSDMVARIKNERLDDLAPELPAYVFFSRAEIKKRIGRDNLDGISGFIQDVEATILLPAHQVGILKNATLMTSNGRFTLLKSSQSLASETIPISLSRIPMLRWAAVRRPYGHGADAKVSISRDFRWELSYLGSPDILGSAEWNDLEGISTLVERLEDTESLSTQQALMNPGFFR